MIQSETPVVVWRRYSASYALQLLSSRWKLDESKVMNDSQHRQPEWCVVVKCLQGHKCDRIARRWCEGRDKSTRNHVACFRDETSKMRGRKFRVRSSLPSLDMTSSSLNRLEAGKDTDKDLFSIILWHLLEFKRANHVSGSSDAHSFSGFPSEVKESFTVGHLICSGISKMRMLRVQLSFILSTQKKGEAEVQLTKPPCDPVPVLFLIHFSLPTSVQYTEITLSCCAC